MSLRPEPPRSLNSAGKALWGAILGDLPAHLELDARELSVLATACGQADLNAALEAVIKRDGVVAKGASGQRRINSAAVELRQGRTALARLLEQIDLGAEHGFSEAPSSRRAKKAADTRWRAA